MSRPSRLLLAAACVCLVVTIAARGQSPQAQGPGGPNPQGDLPEGSGKELVLAACNTTCHATNLITGSTGYSREEWLDLIDTMMRLPDSQAETVADYLSTHFPKKPGREPVLVPGDVSVTFREWVVPTLGQRARDPLQLPDGTIWWTGQFASLVGWLDPRTGEMREVQLTPDVRPHSIIADQAGHIWYMGNGNGTIGRLDPATGDIAVYPMPDPAARDPHTPIFDGNGTLWFTLQRSNMVGRLDPATGQIDLVTVPTPNALPYGIKVSSQGVPWVAYNGSNKLASIDPATMEVREHVLPNDATRVRRLALTSDDMVWYVNSSRGYLGRLNPRTGEVKEWPSPSGPRSHPYAIAVVDDVIWYNESGQRPDALVRFDPRTERFQSWAIPSGVGIVRHMTVSPEGNLVIAQSSTNRVGLAIIGANSR